MMVFTAKIPGTFLPLPPSSGYRVSMPYGSVVRPYTIHLNVVYGVLRPVVSARRYQRAHPPDSSTQSNLTIALKSISSTAANVVELV